jgi:formylglycine-generating enzyme required for sulfatase activity
MDARFAEVALCACVLAFSACGRRDTPVAAPAEPGPAWQRAQPDLGSVSASSADAGAKDAGLVVGVEVAAAPGASANVPEVASMAALPGGTFTMGARGDTVKVGAFSLDVTEVTADAYAACVRAGSCTSDGLACDKAATYGVGGKGNHPINCVDWYQATAYCNWAGKRLPTEEEWEWAARGQARGTQFPWGSNLARTSQVCSTPSPTCPVGSFVGSDAPGGIHDLVGNVGEWTASKYDSSGSGYYAFRGGRWVAGNSSYVRVATRYGSDPASHMGTMGFRCAR